MLTLQNGRTVGDNFVPLLMGIVQDAIRVITEIDIREPLKISMHFTSSKHTYSVHSQFHFTVQVALCFVSSPSSNIRIILVTHCHL